MATEKVTVPDFGDVQEIIVIEVYVQVGDTVAVDESLIALESEKAVMDIPAPVAGVVQEIFLTENEAVKSGAPIMLIEVEAKAETEGKVNVETKKERQEEAVSTVENVELEQDVEPQQKTKPGNVKPNGQRSEQKQEGGVMETLYHATPSVRAFARSMNVELASLIATGPKGRITKEDVQTFLDAQNQKQDVVAVPSTTERKGVVGEDYSRFGTIETIDLSRIKKVSGPHLQKSWQAIPHVTQFDEADMTELEKFRDDVQKLHREERAYSPLVFVIKAVVATLKAFPFFNSSLHDDGRSVVLKKYYNIGIAVDTENGLMVPVIHNADTKGVVELAAELATLSQAARESKLTIDQLQGASFTVSSLGGIGGTGFTPIVNAPQVAILGLSKSYMKPVWREEQGIFVPRRTLPFSVSYDHRVIDGADGARFCRALSGYIEDLRTILL